MKKEYIPFVEELIELAIREDIGDGDHTSLATIPADARGKMQLLVKQDGIIAGIEVARMVFDRLDGSVAFDQRIEDGACVRRGDIAFYVEGRILSLLQAERIVLNIMQRMSGVATQTAAYVKLLEGTHCRVLDTRKTTPGMEVRSLEDIDEVFAAGGADRIMFDNFTVEMTREGVRRIAGRCETESSGGIREETMRAYAECGVDYVSVGALTHQIRSLDMSLKACV